MVVTDLEFVISAELGFVVNFGVCTLEYWGGGTCTNPLMA